MSAAARAGALALTALVVAVCVVLGYWQWTRASQQAITVAPEPAVPIAEVLLPATKASPAVGRQVTVVGTWADEDPVIVVGRDVDGVPAQMLVRALTVDADATGTGEPATLAVIVGWRPEGAEAGPGVGQEETAVTLTGYLRAPEEATVGDPAVADPQPGVVYTDSISPSEWAQQWPSPLYSAVLSSYEETPGWQPLPPPPPETTLNFRSIAYAVEWWLFGLFALFISWRWMRDNGRKAQQKEPAP